MKSMNLKELKKLKYVLLIIGLVWYLLKIKLFAALFMLASLLVSLYSFKIKRRLKKEKNK